MQTQVKAKYLRIAPRKVRLVADMIRGKSIADAKNILNFTIKRGVLPLQKLLNQGSKNIQNNFQLDPLDFFVARITVDEGPKFKRWEAKSRGQAGEIQKKTSHVTIVLEEGKQGAKKIAAIEAKTVKDKKEKVVKPGFKPEKEIFIPKKELGSKKIFRRKSI